MQLAHSQNKQLSNTREELAGCGLAHSLPEAGGRGEAGASQSRKGANSAPEMASPTKLQIRFQFLTKDFLRFWMVDICQEGQSQRSAPRRVTRHTTPGAPRNWGWTGRGEVALHLKRARSSSSWLPELL